jgi:hypothetical protein
MNNYEEIKEHLLLAAEMIISGADMKHETDRIKSRESQGIKPQQIIRDLLSQMHLVMVHGQHREKNHEKA